MDSFYINMHNQLNLIFLDKKIRLQVNHKLKIDLK